MVGKCACYQCGDEAEGECQRCREPICSGADCLSETGHCMSCYEEEDDEQQRSDRL